MDADETAFDVEEGAAAIAPDQGAVRGDEFVCAACDEASETNWRGAYGVVAAGVAECDDEVAGLEVFRVADFGVWPSFAVVVPDELDHGGISGEVGTEHFAAGLCAVGKDDGHCLGSADDVACGEDEAVPTDDNAAAGCSVFGGKEGDGGGEDFFYYAAGLGLQGFEVLDVLDGGGCLSGGGECK